MPVNDVGGVKAILLPLLTTTVPVGVPVVSTLLIVSETLSASTSFNNTSMIVPELPRGTAAVSFIAIGLSLTGVTVTVTVAVLKADPSLAV